MTYKLLFLVCFIKILFFFFKSRIGCVLVLGKSEVGYQAPKMIEFNCSNLVLLTSITPSVFWSFCAWHLCLLKERRGGQLQNSECFVCARLFYMYWLINPHMWPLKNILLFSFCLWRNRNSAKGNISFTVVQSAMVMIRVNTHAWLWTPLFPYRSSCASLVVWILPPALSFFFFFFFFLKFIEA